MSKNNIYTWESVDWQLAGSRVLKLQRRIYKAQTNGLKEQVHGLQKELLNSLNAKLLAVRSVTTLNKGEKTQTSHISDTPNIPYIPSNISALTSPANSFFSLTSPTNISALTSPQVMLGKGDLLRIKMSGRDVKMLAGGKGDLLRIKCKGCHGVLREDVRMLGVDKQVIVTHDQKMKMAQNLSLNGKSSLIKRVWTSKLGKTPLGIPIIQDRAKQALAKLALEPQWEAVFEPNSYGFRPGRSAHDAIEAIFLALRHNKPKWVFNADIEKCFDRINHSYLLAKLQTFPQMEKQICAWLKAGIFEEYANIPSANFPSMDIPLTSDTPLTRQECKSVWDIRGIISPLLSNIALHGLEEYLKEYVSNLSLKPFSTIYSGKRAKSNSLTIVRYADHFVVIHAQREILELCIEETRKWLSKTGLEISEEKSSVKDCRESFNFLGFTIILVKKNQGRYKVKIVPSRDNQIRYLDKVRTIITRSRTISTYELIRQLRPIVIGWANYYRFCECAEIFAKQSNLLFQMIRHWVFRRHPKEGRMAVKEKYWPSGRTYYYDDTKHQDNWVLCGKTLKKGLLVENHLPQMQWIHSRKFVKIQGVRSPFDSDHPYWTLRNSRYSRYSLKVYKLYKVQKGICPMCKYHFDTFSKLEVDHIVPRALGGKDLYSNLQLLHESCHLKKTAADKLSISKAKMDKSNDGFLKK